MKGAVQLNILEFSLIYLLLIIVLVIMRKSKIDQTKLLLIASIRMTVQLVLAGFILTYIFENPHPLFILALLMAMILFSIRRVLSKNKNINRGFKWAVALSITISGIFVLAFFVLVVVGETFFNPQYTIPLAGMIIGNAMTGITLGLKTFTDNLKTGRHKIDTLLNLGVTPKKILIPYVNNALEDGDNIFTGDDDRSNSFRHTANHCDYVPNCYYGCNLYISMFNRILLTEFRVSYTV